MLPQRRADEAEGGGVRAALGVDEGEQGPAGEARLILLAEKGSQSGAFGATKGEEPFGGSGPGRPVQQGLGVEPVVAGAARAALNVVAAQAQAALGERGEGVLAGQPAAGHGRPAAGRGGVEQGLGGPVDVLEPGVYLPGAERVTDDVPAVDRVDALGTRVRDRRRQIDASFARSLAAWTEAGNLLRVAATQGMAVVLTSDHGHVVDRHGTKVDTATEPASARHRLPGGGPLAEREIALSGPRVVWPEPGASVVALWDADSRYTALKAGYHGGASLAEVTIPVLAFLPFGAEPPKGWRELGDQRPAWWAPEETGKAPLPDEHAARPVTATASAPKKPTGKAKKEQAEVARTHDTLFDVALTAGGDDALLTPTVVSRTETLVTALLDSETYQAQLGGLARKPQQEQVHKALAALLDAGGTLPVTALAQRAGMPVTRGDGFAAVLRQLLNYDGVQVLEILPDGRTVRMHEVLLREQFAATSPERVRTVVDDAYVADLARAVGGALGGKVGVAPRLFLKKLVGDVLDRVDQFDDFDPRQHYKLTVAGSELTDEERNLAATATGSSVSADDIDLEL
ncbi:BREX-2 system phosphatase PglZ [Streptomyces werraensis]|uniref:BREX-2 system phosphatase PglZ n=1 Tax=Streptomyces werraensis TaxID=68284 RepID=UPI00381A7499